MEVPIRGVALCRYLQKFYGNEIKESRATYKCLEISPYRNSPNPKGFEGVTCILYLRSDMARGVTQLAVRGIDVNSRGAR